MTLDDLFGSYAPELDKSLGKMVFKFQVGLLVTAVQKEAVVLFDELNLAPSEVLSALCGLFSSSPSTPFYAGNTELAKAGAIFVCTMNPAKVGGGRQELPPSLQGILTTVYLQAFTNEEIRTIVRRSYGQDLIDAAKPIRGTDNLEDVVLAIHFGIAAVTKQSPNLFNLRTIQNLVAVLKNIELKTLLPEQAHYWLLAALILVYSSHGSVQTRASAVFFITRTLAAAGVSFGEDVSPEAKARMWNRRQVEIAVNGSELCIRVQLESVSTELIFARQQLNDDYFSFARAFMISSTQARQLESVALACKSKRIVLLEGEGVAGKTSLVRQLAWLCSKRLLVVSVNMETEVSDLLGGFAPQVNGLTPEWFEDFQAALTVSAGSFNPEAIADLITIATSLEGDATDIDTTVTNIATLLQKLCQLSPEWTDKLRNFASSTNTLPFRFIEGPVILAMRRGHWLLLDNINAARPEILERINSLGEADASIHMMELGMEQQNSVVTPHKGFQCFATSTTKRGSAYALSEAFRNRCIIVPCCSMDAVPPVFKENEGKDEEEDEENEEAEPENEPTKSTIAHLQALLAGGLSHALIGATVHLHLAALNMKPKEGLCGYQPTFRNLRYMVDMLSHGVDLDTALCQAYDTFMPAVSPAQRSWFTRGGSAAAILSNSSCSGSTPAHPQSPGGTFPASPLLSPGADSSLSSPNPAGVDAHDLEEVKTAREVLNEHSMQECANYLEEIPAGGGLLDMHVGGIVHSSQELQELEIVLVGAWNVGHQTGHITSPLNAKNIILCIKKSVLGSHYEVRVADAVVELKSDNYPTVTLQLRVAIKTIETAMPSITMSNIIPAIGLSLNRLNEVFDGSLIETIECLPWKNIRSLRTTPFQNYQFEVPLKPRSEALLTLHAMEPIELGLFRASMMGKLRVNELKIKREIANADDPIIDLSAELCLGEFKLPLNGRYKPCLGYQHFCGLFNDNPMVVNLADFGCFFSRGAKEAIPGDIKVHLGASDTSDTDNEVYLGKHKGADGIWWKLRATKGSAIDLPFGLQLSQFDIEFGGNKIESRVLDFNAEASALVITDESVTLCSLGMTLEREVTNIHNLIWEIKTVGAEEEDVVNSKWGGVLAQVFGFGFNGIKRPSKMVTPALFTVKWPFNREHDVDSLLMEWTDVAWEMIPEIGVCIQQLSLKRVSWTRELSVCGGEVKLTVNMLGAKAFHVEATLMEVREQRRFEIQPPHDEQPLKMIGTTFATLAACVFGPEQQYVAALIALEPAPVEDLEFAQPITAYFDGRIDCFLVFRVAHDWCPLGMMPQVCCKQAHIEVCKHNEHNEGKEEEEEEAGYGGSWTVVLKAGLSFYELNMPPVVVQVPPACGDDGSFDGVIALRMKSGQMAEANTLGEVLHKLEELIEEPAYLMYPVVNHVTAETFEVILQGADHGSCYAEFCFTDWPVFGPSWEAFELSKVALEFDKTGQLSTSTLCAQLNYDASGCGWPLRWVGTSELKDTVLDSIVLEGSVRGEIISLASLCTNLLFPKLGIPSATQVPLVTFSGADYQVTVSADAVEFELQLVGGSWDVEYDPLVSMFRRLLWVEDISCKVTISNKTGCSPIKIEGCFLLMGEAQTPRFGMSIEPGCDVWQLSIPEGEFKRGGKIYPCNLLEMLPYIGSLAGCITFGFDKMQMKLALHEHLLSLNGEMVLSKDRFSILPLSPFDLRLENIKLAVSYNPAEYMWQDRIGGTTLSADLKLFGLTMAIRDIQFPPTGNAIP
jgi:MoxR-like ATPase